MPVYLIDGYNLLFFLSENASSYQKKREKTLSLVLDIAPFLPGKILLIFDGVSGKHLPDSIYKETVQVEFSPKGMSADEFILEKIQGRKKGASYTVITSDKKLQASCLELGVMVFSIPIFLEKMALKKRKGQKEKKPSSESLQERKRLQKIFEKLLEES